MGQRSRSAVGSVAIRESGTVKKGGPDSSKSRGRRIQGRASLWRGAHRSGVDGSIDESLVDGRQALVDVGCADSAGGVTVENTVPWGQHLIDRPAEACTASVDDHHVAQARVAGAKGRIAIIEGDTQGKRSHLARQNASAGGRRIVVVGREGRRPATLWQKLLDGVGRKRLKPKGLRGERAPAHPKKSLAGGSDRGCQWGRGARPCAGWEKDPCRASKDSKRIR